MTAHNEDEEPVQGNQGQPRPKAREFRPNGWRLLLRFDRESESGFRVHLFPPVLLDS